MSGGMQLAAPNDSNTMTSANRRRMLGTPGASSTWMVTYGKYCRQTAATTARDAPSTYGSPVGARPRITAAGRRRVADALHAHGLLLVQGQAEIPSVADLLAGEPVTTRGYSWDYEPAWRLTAEYESGADVAVAKLFRGRRTLIDRRLWAAVDVLAGAARAGVLTGTTSATHRTVLAAVDEQPGIPLGQLRDQLGVDRRAFDRTRRDLEQWLCLFGRERDDVAFHTHEPALFPWSHGPIARGRRGRAPRDIESALDLLRAAPDATPDVPTARLFPAARVRAPV